MPEHSRLLKLTSNLHHVDSFEIIDITCKFRCFMEKAHPFVRLFNQGVCVLSPMLDKDASDIEKLRISCNIKFSK